VATSFEMLGRMIKQVQWKHHRALDSRMRVNGTTLVQWDALRAMYRRPGATARQLAAATFQSEQSFGVMAARMEANGLIMRTPGVGRRIEHHLTPDGEQVLQSGRRVAREVFSRSLGVLNAAEREQLYALLARVYEGPA
jgi:DNA-binding MarR family transcriptional regulator